MVSKCALFYNSPITYQFIKRIDPEKGKAVSKVDVWNFGVLLYNLISREKDPFIPHQEATMEEIFVCTCDKEIKFFGEEWDEYSDELKDLIQ